MDSVLKQNLKGTYGTMYYVKDMKKSLDWYKSLGLEPSYESTDWSEFSINGHSICLHPQDDKLPHTSGFIILRVNNIRDIAAELARKKIQSSDIQEVHPGAYSIKIFDPDNNVISLYEGP